MRYYYYYYYYYLVAGADDADDSWNTGYACEGSELEIRCAEATTIHVINANYGRLDSRICSDQADSDADWNLRCVSRQSLTVVRERSDRNLSTTYACECFMPSVLRRCWLGGRKGIRPVKN